MDQNDNEKSMSCTNSGELKKKLTQLQFEVTQQKLTELPFSGEYVDLKDNGMYCCVVCDEPLFSSQCKYNSGSGWPSFYDAIHSDKIQTNIDVSNDMERTEICCKKCGSHLGHIFNDGPKPTGNRYCVNSASLKFAPQNDGNTKK